MREKVKASQLTAAAVREFKTSRRVDEIVGQTEATLDSKLEAARHGKYDGSAGAHVARLNVHSKEDVEITTIIEAKIRETYEHRGFEVEFDQQHVHSDDKDLVDISVTLRWPKV